jgi:hypothetical protein
MILLGFLMLLNNASISEQEKNAKKSSNTPLPAVSLLQLAGVVCVPLPVV